MATCYCVTSAFRPLINHGRRLQLKVNLLMDIRSAYAQKLRSIDEERQWLGSVCFSLLRVRIVTMEEKILQLMSTVFEDLIDVVKAHPIIYDIRVEGYQKRGSRREEAWITIARCMQQRGHNITNDGCRRRWNKLKFAYTRDRTLRRIQGIPPRRSTGAKYFGSLGFLNPFLDDYKARPKAIRPIILDSESEDDSTSRERFLDQEAKSNCVGGREDEANTAKRLRSRDADDDYSDAQS